MTPYIQNENLFVAHDRLLYRKQIVGRQICKIRETIPEVHNGIRSHESDMSIVLVKLYLIIED